MSAYVAVLWSDYDDLPYSILCIKSSFNNIVYELEQVAKITFYQTFIQREGNPLFNITGVDRLDFYCQDVNAVKDILYKYGYHHCNVRIHFDTYLTIFGPYQSIDNVRIPDIQQSCTTD